MSERGKISGIHNDAFLHSTLSMLRKCCIIQEHHSPATSALNKYDVFSVRNTVHIAQRLRIRGFIPQFPQYVNGVVLN
jgi:hypothetical protein